MPWNGQQGGGGPWGGGGDGQSPWGRGGNGPGGLPPQGPELPEWLDRLWRRFGQWFSGDAKQGRFLSVIVVVLLAIWLATGIYRVLPDEQGVVLRFGAYAETAQPGLHYHLPYPIETVYTPKVTFVNRTDIGISTDNASDHSTGEQRPEEALMLTGDENIVDINLSVFWVVKDARAYLFNIRRPSLTVKSSAESAIREIVGRTPIASVLAEGRHQVETDMQTLLQSILDSYDSGIEITQVQLQRVDPPKQVIEAFRDVQRARTDQERARNEAEAYHNDIVPRARGDAAQIIQDAEAYKAQVTAKAQGDAERFQSVLNAYREAKEVTATRLYIEAIEQVMKSANKVLIDRGTSGSGVVPYLPLPPVKATADQAGKVTP